MVSDLLFQCTNAIVVNIYTVKETARFSDLFVFIEMIWTMTLKNTQEFQTGCTFCLDMELYLVVHCRRKTKRIKRTTETTTTTCTLVFFDFSKWSWTDMKLILQSFIFMSTNSILSIFRVFYYSNFSSSDFPLIYRIHRSMDLTQRLVLQQAGLQWQSTAPTWTLVVTLVY